jgi:proton-translocating NADH-quinone oxidoreductase chain L
MYLNVISLPLLSFFSGSLFGRFLGPKGVGFITVSSIFSCFILSSFIFFEVGLLTSSCNIKVFYWISVELTDIYWGFYFDSLTCIMLVVITSISSLVHLYSTEYMSHDPHLPRFLSYLSLFTFFMLILVTSDNFLGLFVGWEGVGLCSFLLINFWFTRIQANKAAIKAMIINRVGDFCLVMAIFIIFICFKTLNFNSFLAIVQEFKDYSFYFLFLETNVLEIISLFLFLGAIGKSAQLGLHTWLPDAMEGPTPVSALIHAATMVTAGVFLITRCSALYELTTVTINIVAIAGALTAFFAATTGLLQNDLKRVIAYSTCSQLGYMFFACGVSYYSVGVFHLFNHAFFKALLFLSAGSVIHAVADEQDMRKMGGLLKLIPFTYSMIFIGSCSLMGLPFLTGFYSKDLILEAAFSRFNTVGLFCYWLGVFAAFFTAFYSTRLAFLTFLVKPNGFKIVILNAAESSIRLTLPLMVLAIPSIFIGFLFKDLMTGLGTDYWSNAVYISSSNYSQNEAEFLPQIYKLVPLCTVTTSIFLAYLFYSYYLNLLFLFKTTTFGRLAYNFLSRKWFFDKLYNEVITQNSLVFAYNSTYKTIDRGVIEFLGPYGLTFAVKNKTFILSLFQSGYLYHYSFIFLTGLFFFCFIVYINIFFIDFRFFILFLLFFVNYKCF